jgi:hypothetical protein
MIIQVQRESGLQSRTFVLGPRQVRVLAFLMSRTGKILVGAAAVIILFLSVEAARIPSLMYRISQMEHTAVQLDTLEHSLSRLQKRYDQVRTMMGANSDEGAESPAAPGPSGLTVPRGRSVAAAGGVGNAPDDQPVSPRFVAAEDAGAADGTTDSTAQSSRPSRLRRRRAAVAPAVPAVDTTPPDSGATPSPQAVPQ